MIRKILTYYAERLEEYLSRTHRQPEGIATVGLIGTASEETPDKLVVSLVNLEKEASGDGVYMQRASGGYSPVGHSGVHPVHAEVQYGRRGVHHRSGTDVHNGPAQHLDDNGRPIPPVSHL